jgi:hypothetical protein
MGSYNYAPIQKAAANLISQFGQGAVIRRRNVGDFAVSVVVIEYHLAERVGKLIQFNDRKALLAAQGLPFLPINVETDQLILDVDSKVLQIVSAFQVAPGGIGVIFELQVRG